MYMYTHSRASASNAFLNYQRMWFHYSPLDSLSPLLYSFVYMYIVHTMYMYMYVQCTWRDVTVVWIRLLSCLLYTCTVHCTWECVTAAFVVCLMYIFWQINKIIPTVTYHPSFVPQDDDQMQADKLAVSTCMTLFCTCVCMCSFNLSSYTCICIYRHCIIDTAMQCMLPFHAN